MASIPPDTIPESIPLTAAQITAADAGVLDARQTAIVAAREAVYAAWETELAQEHLALTAPARSEHRRLKLQLVERGETLADEHRAIDAELARRSS